MGERFPGAVEETVPEHEEPSIVSRCRYSGSGLGWLKDADTLEQASVCKCTGEDSHQEKVGMGRTAAGQKITNQLCQSVPESKTLNIPSED